MDSTGSSEDSLDSIDVTIFEDFYYLDITLPYIEDPVAEPSLPVEQTFSVFTANSNAIKVAPINTPSINKKPLIIFSPAVVSEPPKSILIDSKFSPVIESIEASQTPEISVSRRPVTFSTDLVKTSVFEEPKSVSIDPHFSSVNDSVEINDEMKENQTIETVLPNRPETPIDFDKTLVLKQISARTNQSPLYTPVTAMVSRFKNLALETPFVLSNKRKTKLLHTPSNLDATTTPPPPTTTTVVDCNNSVNRQHQTRVEKVKLISPLLKSPKFKPVSTRFPFRSNSKVTNSKTQSSPNLKSKQSPTVDQYKANQPVIQGSRIPVLKLN